MKPQANLYDTRKATVNDQYLEQKVMSAKPEELTLMLYEGIVKFIKQAMLYNDQKNVEKTHTALMRAQAIITELDVTLNEEYEVSQNLKQMYGYMNARLLDANLEKETAIMAEILVFAEDLRDTWKEAMVLAR
ncbi:MAG: flagellar export chaperone FliS [Clostridia bacterium]|nr:flagellar export chaperone FliS [Clostridia bacterium]